MKTLIRISTVLLLGTALSTLCGCTSAPKTWGNGRYGSPDYAEPYSYSEGLNEFDQKHLLEEAIAQLEKCPKMRRNSVYMVSEFENQTSDTLLDVAMLNRELNDYLTTHGFTIIDKNSRPDIFNEMQYQSTGYTIPAQAAVKGRQAGVEYLLQAAISSKAQNTDDVKTVRYRISLEAVSLESSVVVCSPSVEIKKVYERTRVAL
jgi:hypothetical protein